MYKAAALEKAEENVLALAAVFPALAPHLISYPPEFSSARHRQASCLRVRTQRMCVCCFHTITKQKRQAGRPKKKGRITYIKRQLDRWKVCFFILLAENISGGNCSGLWDVCSAFCRPAICISLLPEIANRSTRKDTILQFVPRRHSRCCAVLLNENLGDPKVFQVLLISRDWSGKV